MPKIVNNQDLIEPKDIPGNTMIEMIKVSRTYAPDIKALSNISFTVDTGELFSYRQEWSWKDHVAQTDL